MFQNSFYEYNAGKKSFGAIINSSLETMKVLLIFKQWKFFLLADHHIQSFTDIPQTRVIWIP